MEDVLHFFGQALTILATWLNHVSSPLPWPLVIAFLFLPLVVALRITIWILRGRVWPVTCMYFHTQQRRADKPCRTPVPGEWRYCRHHKHVRVMSDGHLCDPKLSRWEAKTSHGKVYERTDIRGVGFVSLLSNRNTLLFHKGIARRPGAVFSDLPEVWRQFIAGFSTLRRISLRSIFSRPIGIPLEVTARMPRVIRATRITLITFGTGLVLVGISVFLRSTAQQVTQYSSTTAFMVAWNSLRFGIWKDPVNEPRWVRSLIVDTVKGMGFFVGLAIVAVILNYLGTAANNAQPTPIPRPTQINSTSPAKPQQPIQRSPSPRRR
jgi:hypothetical protein